MTNLDLVPVVCSTACRRGVMFVFWYVDAALEAARNDEIVVNHPDEKLNFYSTKDPTSAFTLVMVKHMMVGVLTSAFRRHLHSVSPGS